MMTLKREIIVTAPITLIQINTYAGSVAMVGCAWDIAVHLLFNLCSTKEGIRFINQKQGAQLVGINNTMVSVKNRTPKNLRTTTIEVKFNRPIVITVHGSLVYDLQRSYRSRNMPVNNFTEMSTIQKKTIPKVAAHNFWNRNCEYQCEKTELSGTCGGAAIYT